MSVASEFEEHFTAAVGGNPFTPITIYCRILLIVDNFLKNNTEIPYSNHIYISKYFANLWRIFYENKEANSDNIDYLVSIDYNVISVGALVSINNFLNTEIRALIKSNHNISDESEVLLLSLVGNITSKVKKIILDHNKYWSSTSQPIYNEHTSVKAKRIFERLSYSVSQRVN
jgi:hypothetical protein